MGSRPNTRQYILKNIAQKIQEQQMLNSPKSLNNSYIEIVYDKIEEEEDKLKSINKLADRSTEVNDLRLRNEELTRAIENLENEVKIYKLTIEKLSITKNSTRHEIGVQTETNNITCGSQTTTSFCPVSKYMHRENEQNRELKKIIKLNHKKLKKLRQKCKKMNQKLNTMKKEQKSKNKRSSYDTLESERFVKSFLGQFENSDKTTTEMDKYTNAGTQTSSFGEFITVEEKIQLEELLVQNHNLELSNEHLEDENQKYFLEIGKLKDELEKFKLAKKFKTSELLNKAFLCKDDSTKRRRKVVLYGDESVKSIAIQMQNLLDKKLFEVIGISKTNAVWTELEKQIWNVTRDLTKEDFIFFNKKVRTFESVRNSTLNNILAVGRFTNLVMSLSYNEDSNTSTTKYNEIENFISVYNKKKNYSIRTICNKKQNNKLRLSKFQLSKLFIHYINCYTVNSKNYALVSVQSTNNNSILSNEKHNQKVDQLPKNSYALPEMHSVLEDLELLKSMLETENIEANEIMNRSKKQFFREEK